MRFFRGYWLLPIAAVALLVSPMNGAAQSIDSAAIGEWESKDHPSECDDIGWALTTAREVTQFDADKNSRCQYVALRNLTGYLAVCGTTEGDAIFSPKPHEQWILCYMQVFYGGTDSVDVSMFDFSLVTSTGRKYDYDMTPVLATGGDGMFPTETLREGQSVEGMLAFVVPVSQDLPYLIEVDPMLDFSLRQADPAVLIIKALNPLTSLV